MSRKTKPIDLTDKMVSAFWARVSKSDGCWEWTGNRITGGYGVLGYEGQPFYAHRISRTIHAGPIPPGLTVDHLCRNRACVNPEHLETVTNRENILRGASQSAINARKTHCPRGHEYDTLNGNGVRGCSICTRAARAKYRKRNRAKLRLEARKYYLENRKAKMEYQREYHRRKRREQGAANSD